MKTNTATNPATQPMTRESYLAATREWKAAYKALSAAQRTAKLAYKQAQRDGDWHLIWNKAGEINRNRITATAMLEQRAAMKVAAAEAYLAARAAAAPTK